MIVPYEKTGGRDEKLHGEKSSEKADEMNRTGSCRCKETSRMTPGELLKVMINDLAFWKRAKRE